MNSISAKSTQRDLESLIQETVREIPSGFGDKYKPVAALATAWADLGEMQKALSIIEGIESEEQRDEALVALVRRAATWDETIQIWKLIFNTSARKRAANIIVEKNFQLPYPTAPAPASEEWPRGTFRYSARWNQAYPLLLIGVLVPALSYGLLYIFFPLSYLWMPLVALGILVSRKSIWREVRNSIPRRWRLPAFLLGLSLAPIWWGIQLSTKTVDRFVPRLRLWKFIFWRRPPVPRTNNQIQWKIAGDLSQYRHFLRFAIHHSSTFDRLLAPLVYGNKNQTELSELLERLPPLKLPQQMPESQRSALLRWEESERSGRWYNVLRSALRTGARNLGISLTRAVVFPVTTLQARYLAKRIKQAHQLHVKGKELLNQNQLKRAVKALKRVVELNPDEPSGWGNYAIALSRNGQIDEAITAYHSALEKGAGTADEFVIWYDLAYTLFYAHRYREAKEAFQRVVDIAPRNDELYENAVRGTGYCKSNLGIR